MAWTNVNRPRRLLPAPDLTVHGFHRNPWILHSVPGRVRLRFDAADAGAARSLAARVPVHPAVRATWWVESIRSLTVVFEPACEIGDILAGAVTSRPVQRTDAPAPRPGLDWGRVLMSCLLALLPLGPLGSVALAAIGAIAEQRCERAAGWPTARPTES